MITTRFHSLNTHPLSPQEGDPWHGGLREFLQQPKLHSIYVDIAYGSLKLAAVNEPELIQEGLETPVAFGTGFLLRHVTQYLAPYPLDEDTSEWLLPSVYSLMS